MIRNKILQKSQLSTFFLMLVIATQSCTSIKLISEYDEITDKTVTELQEKISNYFVVLERTIGKDEAKYENFIDQFDNIKVDLNTLEVRAAAFDKNKIVEEQVHELTEMVNNLEALHKIGFSSIEQIKALRQPFNSAFTAIIKLQLALKRGENTDTNN